MPGPAPKPQELRQRRNIPEGGEWITLPSEPFTGPRPRLPSRLDDGKKPLAATVEAWESWWSSPMAHMWQKADWDGLLSLALLLERFHRKGQLDVLKEIRLQKAQYGLTPNGRRNLRWRLPNESAEDLTAEPAKDRWSSLHVVG